MRSLAKYFKKLVDNFGAVPIIIDMSKQTIKGVVVKTWATDGFNGGLPVFKMRIRTESGTEYIATIMELCNETSDRLTAMGSGATLNFALREALQSAVLLLCPMAPHLCEELWRLLGHSGFAVAATWPVCDEAIARDDQVTVVVQVNGKKRGEVLVAPDADEATVTALALADGNVTQHTAGKAVKKSVFVKGRLLNLVVG